MAKDPQLKLKFTDAEVSAAARAMGTRGGPARARALTPERRREIARMGGRAKGEHYRLRREGK